jgi:hypothetical protein
MFHQNAVLPIKCLVSCAVLSLALVSVEANAEIRLWVTNGAVGSGNLVNRTQLDIACDGDGDKPAVASSTTRAYISVDAADEIRDMPSLYNIPTNEAILQRIGAVQISANFAGLLDGAIDGAIGPGGTAWTGSTNAGALDAVNNCSNWTDNTAGSTGAIGTDNNTNFYLDSGAPTCDDNTRHLYCITYTASVVVPSVSVLPL